MTEIYRETTPEWNASLASRYPQLATMELFDAFDISWRFMNEVKAACRHAERITGRKFSVLAKETAPNGRPEVVQIKRVG